MLAPKGSVQTVFFQLANQLFKLQNAALQLDGAILAEAFSNESIRDQEGFVEFIFVVFNGKEIYCHDLIVKVEIEIES
ncbi:hypothetical protein TYRP_002647 [Tyrophagus putrescentiae]|nr:hypothetical protein TYRP_002647 [Tyrophagus putrescentiae]